MDHYFVSTEKKSGGVKPGKPVSWAEQVPDNWHCMESRAFALWNPGRFDWGAVSQAGSLLSHPVPRSLNLADSCQQTALATPAGMWACRFTRKHQIKTDIYTQLLDSQYNLCKKYMTLIVHPIGYSLSNGLTCSGLNRAQSLVWQFARKYWDSQHPNSHLKLIGKFKI